MPVFICVIIAEEIMVDENRRCHNFAPFLRLKTESISEMAMFHQQPRPWTHCRITTGWLGQSGLGFESVLATDSALADSTFVSAAAGFAV